MQCAGCFDGKHALRVKPSKHRVKFGCQQVAGVDWYNGHHVTLQYVSLAAAATQQNNIHGTAD